MRLASRLRASRLATAMGLLGAVLLLSPPPALAGRDDDSDSDSDKRGRYWHYDRGHYDRHDRHDRRHRHNHRKHHGKHYGEHDERHHVHGEWCDPRRGRGYYAYRPAPVWYAPPPRPHRGRYYCDPCSHWYHDEHAFHRHVHHHHHVPAAVVPLVIMATVFGAVFGGY